MKRLFLVLLAVAAIGALLIFAFSDPSRSGAADTNPQESSSTEGQHSSTGADDTPGTDTGDQSARASLDKPDGAKPDSDGLVEVRGSVEHQDGSPAVAIRLRVVQLPGSIADPGVRSMMSDGGSGKQVETGKDGRFVVKIAEDSTALVRLASDSVAFADGENKSVRVVVVKRTNQNVGVWVVAKAATVAGLVLNQDGGPIDGVTVEAQAPRSTIGFVRTLATSQSDAAGKFILKGLPAGTYDLVTVSSDYLPTRQPIKLLAGDEKRGIELRLSEGGRVGGIVQDDLGRPIAAAAVMPIRQRMVDGQMRIESASQREAATTDVEGGFELGGLVGKTPRVRVSHGEHTSVTLSVTPDKRDHLVTLQRLGKISGVLVDAGGKPLSGSMVSWSARRGAIPSGHRQAQVDENGLFSLFTVSPGALILVAEGRHVPVRLALTLKPGEHRENVRLVAEAGASLKVTTVNSEGKPMAAVPVSLREPSGWAGMRRGGFGVRRRAVGPGGAFRLGDTDEPVRTGETDADGNVVFDGLSAGRLEILCRHGELAAKVRQFVDIPKVGRAARQITLHKGGLVRVEVVDGAGKAAASQRFMLRMVAAGDDGAGVEERGKTNERGFAQLGPLPVGSGKAALMLSNKQNRSGGVQVMIAGLAETMPSTEVPFEVRPGLETLIKLTVPDLGILQGVVRDADGPVAGAKVALFPHGQPVLPLGERFGSVTDKQGRYEVADLPPGKYRLRYGRKGVLLPAEEDFVATGGMARKNLALPGGTARILLFSEVDKEPLEDVEIKIARVSKGPHGQTSVRVVSMVSNRAGAGQPNTQRMDISSAGRVTTDEDGVAVLKDLPAGKFELTVRPPRHRMYRKVFEHTGQGAMDLGTVKLQAGGSIRASLKFGSDTDSRVARIRVETLNSKGEVEDEDTEIAMGGSHRLVGMAPGRYRLSAAKAGSRKPSAYGTAVEIEVHAGKAAKLELTVPD